MLKSKRISGGLGNPPEPFYTNDDEQCDKTPDAVQSSRAAWVCSHSSSHDYQSETRIDKDVYKCHRFASLGQIEYLTECHRRQHVITGMPQENFAVITMGTKNYSSLVYNMSISALVQVPAINSALVQVAAIISALVRLGCYHWCSSTGGCYHSWTKLPHSPSPCSQGLSSSTGRVSHRSCHLIPGIFLYIPWSVYKCHKIEKGGGGLLNSFSQISTNASNASSVSASTIPASRFSGFPN